MAVEEPRARVVGREADRDVVVSAGPGRDSVAPDGVVVVVLGRAGAADYGKGVLCRPSQEWLGLKGTMETKVS